MDENEKLLSFLQEVEELAVKRAITMERHEMKRRGNEWHILVKFGFPKVVTLQVQSGKHVGVSHFGH